MCKLHNHFKNIFANRLVWRTINAHMYNDEPRGWKMLDTGKLNEEQVTEGNSKEYMIDAGASQRRRFIEDLLQPSDIEAANDNEGGWNDQLSREIHKSGWHSQLIQRAREAFLNQKINIFDGQKIIEESVLFINERGDAGEPDVVTRTTESGDRKGKFTQKRPLTEVLLLNPDLLANYLKKTYPSEQLISFWDRQKNVRVEATVASISQNEVILRFPDGEGGVAIPNVEFFNLAAEKVGQ